jgi:hypothetical protein
MSDNWPGTPVAQGSQWPGSPVSKKVPIDFTDERTHASHPLTPEERIFPAPDAAPNNDRSLSNINPATAYLSDYGDRVRRDLGGIKGAFDADAAFNQWAQVRGMNFRNRRQFFAAREAFMKEHPEYEQGMRSGGLGVVGNAVDYIASPVEAAADSTVGRSLEAWTGGKLKRDLAGDVAGAILPIGAEVKAVTAPEKALALSLKRSGKTAGEIQAAIVRLRDATHAKDVVAPVAAFTKKVKGGQDLSPAQKLVLKRIAQTRNVTAQNMLDLARKTPEKPLTLMDVGGPKVQGLAGKVARTPEGGAELQNFLHERTRGQTERLDTDVSRDIAHGTSFETIEALKAARSKAADPLYKAAEEANPVVRSSVIDEIVRSRLGKRAWDEAVADAQTEAAMSGERQADKYSLRVLDGVKQKLDDVVSREFKAGNGNEARLAKGLRDRLLDELDAADRTGNYAKAREAWSGPTQSATAVEFGERAITGRMDPQEIAAGVKKMTPNDREFAKIGVAKAIRDLYSRVGRNANSARAIADNPAFEARLLPLFENKAKYQRFVDSVLAEDTMFRTDAEVTRGSKTAARQMEDETHPAVEHAANALSVLGKAKAGNLVGAGIRAAEIVGNQATKLSPDMVRELTDILTTPISDANSHAARLLRDHHAVAPGTRNFLSQVRNRLAPPP